MQIGVVNMFGWCVFTIYRYPESEKFVSIN